VVALGDYDVTVADEVRSQVRNVSQLIMHKEYDPPTYENDIAILRLSKPAVFNSYVWPICLPDPEDMVNIENKTAIVTGKISQNRARIAHCNFLR